MDQSIWGDTQSWALILGVVSPLPIAVLNQSRWPGWAKQTVALAFSAALGLLTCLANGEIGEGQTVLQVVALTAAASYVSYKTLLNQLAGKVEEVTSPSSASRHDYSTGSRL